MSATEARVAVVTGGAQGLGAAICLRLAKDGFDIAIVDLPTQKEAVEKLINVIQTENAGRRAIAAYADVSSQADIQTMAEKVVAELGGIHVFVSNAGVCALPAPFADLSIEEFDRQMNINARGTFLSFRAAARVMIAQGKGGKLLATSSIAGLKGMGAQAGYSASKFAIRGIVQSAAASLAPHGITANAYCPGLVETPLLAAQRPHIAALANIPIEAVDSILPIPLGRIGQPEDIANVVSFLASSNSDYITGQSFAVDGGVNFS
ncbi:hypothetical protein BOTBODRAFT_54597 [Botryobasidium botryosum FD-172 SS1]|uniref:Uncharacterized protein n=1 Tax=Botryobasidium botryosum (strain FD-172 SS1) TaxID=930990 RepID=A0A067MVX8_BOTB1|nr:hypothetical protein BOTBODRAFT_54597 [Botryobasidium botryosum FD-172 SS1]